jgi:UDP:flavonoid glycosyltransferase YjiC (YdhE family)
VRVLFASTRGAGHFNPLVPFADACLRHDHEVLVAGPPSLAGVVEGHG